MTHESFALNFTVASCHQEQLDLQEQLHTLSESSKINDYQDIPIELRSEIELVTLKLIILCMMQGFST